jgi:hypothetical protein
VSERAWIAEELFDAVYPDGRRECGCIAIEAPRVVDDDGNARCAVQVRPFHYGIVDTTGAGTLQALVSALHLAGALVGSFLKSGGRLVDRDTGEDIAIQAVLGPLLAPP